MIIFYFFIFILGLVLGSFLTSFTYRIIKGEILPKGRSYCPKCKKQIAWYDNIPLLSYLILKGKCRDCHSNISIRYPLIELFTGTLFVILAIWTPPTLNLGAWSLPYLLIITFLLIAIFITDWEHQIIPDELSFSIIALSFFASLFFVGDKLYIHLLSGFCAALFLLSLHLITLGRGMGLGDVKLALGVGIILGFPFTITWFFVSFILGAVIGLLLLLLGLTKFGKHIAFGPFLILSFFVVLFCGEKLTKIVMPYL